MEQYLLELIKSNNRVIVPNFGAFIVSRDAGTTVLFNNFLSFNDGLLINHISSRKGIDTTEATQQVSDFVDKIKEELDEKGEYTIEKLGRFTKDQSGILRFTQDPYLAKVLPDSPEQEKPLEKDDDNELLDIDSSDSADKTLPEAKKEEKEKKKIPGSKKESKLLSLEEKKSESSGKPSLPKASTAKKTPLPGSPEARKRVSSSGTYEDKRDGLPPWVIALIILVPVILIILYLFFWHDKDEKDSYTVEEKEIVDTVATQPAVDSIAIQKAEEKERLRKEQEAREKAEAEKTATRRHHIIVGSFEKETNAVNLVKSLKEKGFDQASVFRQNNQYMVTAQSFESLLKARDAQEKILQEHRMENWILTKK
ncbi:MAG: HU family DNA-binding protein [Bacteroidota bacterium]